LGIADCLCKENRWRKEAGLRAIEGESKRKGPRSARADLAGVDDADDRVGRGKKERGIGVLGRPIL